MCCASFGEPEINSAGFGGKDCRHKTTGKAKCYCCQEQIDIALNLKTVNFSKLAREVMEKQRAEGKAEDEKNVFLQAADIINDEMTKPIRNRINMRREQVG
jgi:hypothetical protein